MRGHIIVAMAFCLIFLNAGVSASAGNERSDGFDAAAEEEIEELGEVEEISAWSTDDSPRPERAVNLMTARTTRKHAFLIIVDHRNRQPVDEDTFHDFFGFDAGGLKIGLGLRFGILDTLDAGVYRLNGTAELFDVYEFDAKYQILRQEDHFLDVAIRPGVTWFSQEGEEDGAGFFGQLLISRSFRDRLTVGTGLLYHSDSSNDAKTVDDTDHSMAVQALLDVRIFPWLAWSMEMAAGVDGYRSAHPIFTTAVRGITHRHTFSLVFSNTQYMSADGVVTNTNRGFSDM